MAKKPRTVMVNGCFDLLHPGHVAHLAAAARLGSRLVVALTIDSRVEKGDGRPVMRWAERAMMLRALRCVDEVVPAKGTVEALHAVRPQVLVKGTDWRGRMPDAVLRACQSVGAELVFTNTPKQSTTNLIKRIKELP